MRFFYKNFKKSLTGLSNADIVINVVAFLTYLSTNSNINFFKKVVALHS